MSHAQAILLGVIQGLTEFLPVSSSGHLVLAQSRLGLQSGGAAMLAFDVVSHLGTVLAVLLVFRRSIVHLFSNRPHALRVAVLAGVSTAVTAVIGLVGKEWFESLFDDLRAVGLAFIATGILLFMTRRLPRPQGSWKRFGLKEAAVVGVAQAVAIIPGVSRSGFTICAAMFLGLRRRWAAEYSFLIAVPAIAGATVLKLFDLWSAAPDPDGAAAFGPLALGGVVACITGVLALKLLLGAVRRSALHWFSYYLWALGLLALAMSR